jgi:hypothetical protein
LAEEYLDVLRVGGDNIGMSVRRSQSYDSIDDVRAGRASQQLARLMSIVLGHGDDVATSEKAAKLDLHR